MRLTRLPCLSLCLSGLSDIAYLGVSYRIDLAGLAEISAYFWLSQKLLGSGGLTKNSLLVAKRLTANITWTRLVSAFETKLRCIAL